MWREAAQVQGHGAQVQGEGGGAGGEEEGQEKRRAAHEGESIMGGGCTASSSPWTPRPPTGSPWGFSPYGRKGGPCWRFPRGFFGWRTPLKGGGLWGLLSQPLGPCRGDGQGREGPRGLVGLGLRLRRGGDPHPEAPGGKPKAEAFPPGGRPRPHQPHGLQQPGAEEAARRLKRSRQRGLPLPIGVNLGKNRDTPLGRAAEDYLKALRLLEPLGTTSS